MCGSDDGGVDDDARLRTSEGALRPPLISGSASSQPRSYLSFFGASPSLIGGRCSDVAVKVTNFDLAFSELATEGAAGAASSPSLIILGRGLNSSGNLDASTLFARWKYMSMSMSA